MKMGKKEKHNVLISSAAEVRELLKGSFLLTEQWGIKKMDFFKYTTGCLSQSRGAQGTF